MKNLQNFRTSLSTCLYTLTTILLLSIAYTAAAQNEYFEGDPIWNLDVYAISPGGLNFDYFVCGDTTINELNYKRIGCDLHSWWDEYFFYSTNAASLENALCLVRSAGKEMYWYNIDSQEDELLYRFEGEIGDTLYIHPSLKTEGGGEGENDTYFFIIDAIDSVLIGDSYRKIFRTSENWYPFLGIAHRYIFEGIGSFAGPLTEITTLLSDLHCFTWNDEVYVANYTWDNIDQLIPGICLHPSVSEILSAELKIFPNPATDFISLQYPTKSNISTVQIIDLNGRILREINASQFNNTIDISEYPNGIYVARLIGKDSVAYAKFMIER